MTSPKELQDVIDETLALLAPFQDGSTTRELSDVRLRSLLKQCEDECAEIAATGREPIRTIHHFACTGGTLLSRCIEAQPNTVLLSEIDPHSSLSLKVATFAPHDIIRQAQIGLRPLADEAVSAVFMGGISAMHQQLTDRGQRLVLRDHAHSHFCTAVDPSSRPLLRAVLAARFPVRSIVTVRHPLDSFLSLRQNGWVMFSPDTLDEYARRYCLFLDAYDDCDMLRYEDFVTDPDRYAKTMTTVLELAYEAHWRDVISVIKMTGDSGRNSGDITLRPRRAMPEDLRSECRKSTHYLTLCQRLNYDADPDTPPQVII